MIRAPAKVPMDSYPTPISASGKIWGGNTNKTNNEAGANIAKFLAVVGKATEEVWHGEEAGYLT